MLKDILKEEEITQAKLAEDLEISASEMSNIVNGSKKVSVEMADKIAGLLELNVLEIFSDEQIAKPKQASSKSKAKGQMVKVKSLSENRLFLDEIKLSPKEVFSVEESRLGSGIFPRALELRLIERV